MSLELLLAALRDPPPLLRQIAVPGLYLVGGWPRRAWSGKQTADLDLISELQLDAALAHLTAATGAEPFALNERFATRRYVLDGHTLDVGAIAAGGLDADLARRDYTVNTLAVELTRLGPDVRASDLYADTRALDDLASGTLRMVAPTNLEDDPLRILRGYRLWAAEGWQPEPETRQAWSELAHLARTTAAERIHAELLRWLNVEGGTADTLAACADDGVLWELLPPLRALADCPNGPDGAEPVWRHTLECLRRLDMLLAELPAPLAPWRRELEELWHAPVSGAAHAGVLTRLALLLHDAAKPETRQVQADGRATFYGHAEAGAVLASELLAGLKFSAVETECVARLVREHLRLGYYSDHDPVPPRLVYRYLRRLGDFAPLMLLHGIADCAATDSDWAADAYVQHVRAAEQILRHHFEGDAVARPPVLLDGRAIMALLELRPGPLIGRLKDALLEATAAGEVGDIEQAKLFVRNEYERLQSGSDRAGL